MKLGDRADQEQHTEVFQIAPHQNANVLHFDCSMDSDPRCHFARVAYVEEHKQKEEAL